MLLFGLLFFCLAGLLLFKLLVFPVLLFLQLLPILLLLFVELFLLLLRLPRLGGSGPGLFVEGFMENTYCENGIYTRAADPDG